MELDAEGEARRYTRTPVIRRHPIVLLLVAASLGCRPAASTEPPIAVEPEASPEDPSPSLSVIADAIDPGPREPLTVQLPSWLASTLALPETSNPRTLADEAAREWKAWKDAGHASNDAAQIDLLLHIARALVLAERAAASSDETDVETLLVLEQVYALLDAPGLASDRNVFSRLLQSFVGALASEGEVEAMTALDELSRLVFGSLQRAGELHRHTVADLLRRAPDHPEIPNVLGRLAPKLLATDDALAVGAMRRAMAIRGDSAAASHWLDLAAVCARALDVQCSTEALERVETLAPDAALAERAKSVGDLNEHARRAVDLREATSHEQRLELAASLSELQRHDEAKAIFEQLHAVHPEDARPITGYVRAILSDSVDFVAAFEVLDQVHPTEHLDRDWYELSIGVRATALIYYVLPQLAEHGPDEVFAALAPWFARLRQDIDGLEALGAEEGRVLRFVHEVGMEVWPLVRSEDPKQLASFTSALLPRTAALRAEVPDSYHAYVLWLAAAEVASDRAAALAVLDTPPPAAHAEALKLRRARAALDLVALWDARKRVDGMLALIDPLDEPEQPVQVRRLVLDAHLLAHRLGHAEDLAGLERRYAELRHEAGAADPVLLNNLAVVLQAQGRSEEAMALWSEAQSRLEAGKDELVRLNLIATRALSGDTEATDRAELATLASSGSDAEVRLLARAWQVHLATGTQRGKAQRELAKAARTEHQTNIRRRNLPGQGGVVLRSSFDAGLGYSTADALQIQLDIKSVPWHVVPCPVPIPAQ